MTPRLLGCTIILIASQVCADELVSLSEIDCDRSNPSWPCALASRSGTDHLWIVTAEYVTSKGSGFSQQCHLLIVDKATGATKSDILIHEWPEKSYGPVPPIGYDMKVHEDDVFILGKGTPGEPFVAVFSGKQIVSKFGFSKDEGSRDTYFLTHIATATKDSIVLVGRKNTSGIISSLDWQGKLQWELEVDPAGGEDVVLDAMPSEGGYLLIGQSRTDGEISNWLVSIRSTGQINRIHKLGTGKGEFVGPSAGLVRLGQGKCALVQVAKNPTGALFIVDTLGSELDLSGSGIAEEDVLGHEKSAHCLIREFHNGIVACPSGKPA